MWDQDFQTLLVEAGITEWSVQYPHISLSHYGANPSVIQQGVASMTFTCASASLARELKKQNWCRQTDERIEYRPPDNFAPDQNNEKYYHVWCKFVCLNAQDFESKIAPLIEKMKWTSYSNEFDDLITKELTVTKK